MENRHMKNTMALAALAALLAASAALAQAPVIRRGVPRVPGAAQQPPEPEKSPEDYGAPVGPVVFDGTNNPSLKFEKAPYDILLRTYADITGKTMLIAPNLPKAENITLRSQPDVMLTREEYLQAIETILVMNNIALVPAGEKFLRVLPANELRKLGVETHFDEPSGGAHPEDGKMVSQIIQLKNISIEEAKKVIEGFKRGEGQIQLFERTNSILVTDTAENVNRMMEILKYVDIPIENREETHVRPIKFAKAADIKKRLEEIIAEALKDQQQKKTQVEAKQSGAPGYVRREIPNAPPGVVRPGVVRPPSQPEAANNEIIETLISDAERGVIRGKVQIVADERTNLLIFVTRPENMTFFDRIIDVLDVEVQTALDVIVSVFRLEYATAKDVASMLNDLIGNNSTKDDSQDAKNTVAKRDDSGGSSSLADAADRTRRQQAKEQQADERKSRLGELNKDNVKILADERSNAIVVMAAPGDVETIRGIIHSMDIQLSQVVIETVILTLTFKNSDETGVDWVQRAMLVRKNKQSEPVYAFATAGGGGSGTPRDTPTLTGTSSLSSAGGISGWFTLFDLNMDILITAIQNDSRARIVSSPRITTMDNKEATFDATERVYYSNGTTTYDNGNTNENMKNEDVGIKLTVTPRINKSGFITLTVKQEVEDFDGYTTLSGKQYPNITTRNMAADVAVQSGETVVLGGLARNKISKAMTKVPILGSIPLLGRLFRHQSDEHERSEIIVFLTPRVIDTPAQMEDDARKIKATMDTEGVWDSAWSNSRLADPLSEKTAQNVRKNAEQTVAPARYPLTGYLTGLNDPSVTNGTPDDFPINKALRETPEGKVPFVHYSDIDDGSRDGQPVFAKPQQAEDAAPPAGARPININERIVPGSLRYEESVTTVTNAPAQQP